MTATTTVLVPLQPAFSDAGRLALAGYRGLTREAYVLDLRQFTTWCRARSLSLFGVRRVGSEGFARDLEVQGPGPGHRDLAVVHHCRVVQVRRRRGLLGHSRPLTSGGCGWITSLMPSP